MPLEDPPRDWQTNTPATDIESQQQAEQSRDDEEGIILVNMKNDPIAIYSF